MIVAPGPTTIRFRGREIPRGQGFIDLPELECPDGHRIKLDAVVLIDSVGLRCHNRARQGAGECGALLYLLYLPAAGGKRRFYAADVEYGELAMWEQQRFQTDDSLRYLGAWLTRGKSVHSRAGADRL